MKSHLRILCLENDVRDAELVEETLAIDGISTRMTRVETEAEFVASLQQGGFDLIIADYSLSSFDGLAALRIARRDWPDVPFIFVSGTLGEEVAIEALRMGATDYVFKTRLSRITPSVQRALREVEERSERKHAEEALRRSEAYLAEAQRVSRTGSFGWDVSSGEIYWSEETFRIFEYDRTTTPTVELVLQRTHPEDAAFVKEAIERASRDWKDLDLEHRLLMPDGSVKHVHVVGHTERKTSGEIECVGAVMDVTQRRLAEAALRRNETHLSEAQRLSNTGSWVWNAKTWENVFWSKQLYRIYGFDPETASGKYGVARERVHPEDGTFFDETFHRAVRERRDFEMDHRLVLPGGEVKHIHVVGHPVFSGSGELVEYIGTVMDISEQVEAKTALEESLSKIKTSEARLQAIIDTIPTLAWSTEPDGSVEFVNQRWSNYTGLTTEQARGSGWLAAIHPDDIGWLSDQGRITMASGKPFELEARMRRYDGQYRWFMNRTAPLLDEKGKIVKWYGTSTDIDDRKRAEEALRKSQSELAHMSRLTTMGELTASIAHEVNQPLSGVGINGNTCLRWLAADPPNLDEAREAARRVVRDGKRANEVIARIRALTRKDSIAMGRVDINDAIRDVVTLAQGELRRSRVVPRMELADDLPPVLGDRVQLHQVVLNLVMNGLEAMAAAGAERRELVISTQSSGANQIRVAVRDAGVGLDPQSIDRLFEAFYTTKSSGMGMGLSISRTIVANHGGRLWAVANDGPGATFQFTVPRYTETR